MGKNKEKTGCGRSKFWCIAKDEKISIQTGRGHIFGLKCRHLFMYVWKITDT
jgi:hypothetical protein